MVPLSFGMSFKNLALISLFAIIFVGPPTILNVD